MNGLISQIMGPVVDVDFNGYLPKINEAIEVNQALADSKKVQNQRVGKTPMESLSYQRELFHRSFTNS